MNDGTTTTADSAPGSPTGPTPRSASRAKRAAAVGALALVLAGGAATVAYATGGDEAAEYVTFVEPVAGAAEPEGSTGARADCPEKQGGSGERTGSGTAPDVTVPEAPQQAPTTPDESTL